MLLLVLIAEGVTVMLVRGALVAPGSEREGVGVGSGAMFLLVGVAFLFYVFINLRYTRTLPFLMFFLMFGPDPVTRESRPWAYWYGIAAMVALGILCLFAGTVCLLHAFYSVS